MADIRQKQVAEMIKRHFSVLLQQEGGYIYGTQAFVTVTNVKMTPDFNIAKIYLSIFNTENKQEVILEMEHHYTRLKQALAARIGKQMRRMPELKFFIDDTLDEMHQVDTLFQRLEADNQMGRGREEEE
ncbi:MAG: 30S ribosome-binding factor RbfA [Saprospiraceae bacterium]|jgi:ribosome-binding factor A|nr:30S ribosome-binding factor RbfA [Saprospiraceae bacterium]